MSEKCPTCSSMAESNDCSLCNGTGWSSESQICPYCDEGKVYRSTAAEQLADSTLICKCGREHRVVTYKDKLAAANAVVEDIKTRHICAWRGKGPCIVCEAINKLQGGS